MKAFITGATGFVGGKLAAKLRDRGDDVVALVRSPAKAARLKELGCTIVEGDLLAAAAIREGVRGADAVFHVAADYRIGIPASERKAMHEANVTGTEVVLDAASEAGVTKIVYVSTIGYFGNTRGEVVDEKFQRTDLDWLSAYDETKYLAHELVQDRIDQGAPIVITQPGGIYGPGDQSDLADLIDRVRKGKLPFLPMPEVGFNFVHVDDVVEGLLLAHDKGKPGESYVLGGELTTLGGFVETLTGLEGRRPPRVLPTVFVKVSAPFGPIVGKAFGLPPNMREMIKAGDGVTY
ncbi:MAG TPA: NAD-dependent epimerase/dehydratase family protein, partial [Actinomycetota bacterium]|nr:NAD-dependent epimerase/dehydratase family protein [Actinomycetota bacterium]